MSTLDRQKPYGEITGDLKGRRYEQGGKYFDLRGNEIVEAGKPQPAKPVPQKPVAPAPQAAKTEVDEQLAKQ